MPQQSGSEKKEKKNAEKETEGGKEKFTCSVQHEVKSVNSLFKKFFK